MPPAAPNPPPHPPPPNPPTLPTIAAPLVPTFALPVIVTAPLPLPVVVQQQPATGQQANVTTDPNPPPPPPPPPPFPTATPVPLAVGGLPAVPVNIVQVAAPVPVLVLNPTPAGGPALPPSPKNDEKDIYERISQALVTAVNSIGDLLQGVARLNPRTLLDGLNAVVERVPVVGEALAAFNNQLAAFANGLNQTAQRLAQYSPQLAVAQTNAQVAQILGDVRRAQTLGSGLARFTEAQSNLSQAAQDTLTELLRPLLPIVTNILNSLTVAVREIPNLPTDIYNAFVAAVNLIVDGLNAIADKLSFGLAAAIPHLQTIARHTDPRRDTAPLDILEEVLGAQVADSGRQPVATDTAPGFPALGGIF